LRDISVLIPENADENVIMELISCNEEIVSMKIIDRYDGIKNTDRLSVTYRVMIMGDIEAEKVHHEVERQLKGIGCSIRGNK
jgi:prephenate dehydrogenase